MRLCVYPLGVGSTRFAGPACAELPGRDPTLERRSPEAKGGVPSIEICLSFTSWRALGPCLRECDSLARPGDVRRSCDATQPRRHADPHERFQTLRGRHLAFSDPSPVAFAPAGRRVCPFPLEPRVTRRPRRLPPGGEKGRLVASVFLNHPRAPPFASRLHTRESPLRPRPGSVASS